MVEMRWLCVVVSLVALVGAGCESSPRDESLLVSSPQVLEFGTSAVGVTQTMKVRLANHGRAALTLHEVSATPSTVEVTAFEPFTLEAGDERELEVRFTPDSEEAVRGVLTVRTDAANAGQEGVLRLGVGGQGVKTRVEVRTSALDFGGEELGQPRRLELRVFNPTQVESPVRLEFQGPDADLFSSDEVGALRLLKPGEERVLLVYFTPMRPGVAQASVRVTACPGCASTVVPLWGTGLLPWLEVTPSRMEFGRVALGARAEQAILVRNVGSEPLTYGGVRLLDNGSEAFHVVREPSLSGNVLPPGGVLEVRMGFLPLARGSVREARLAIDLRRRNNAYPGPQVSLVGEGGDSCLVPWSERLDFGPVATGERATQYVRLTNSCGTAVTLSGLKLTTRSGGDFLLEPFSLPIPAGQSAAVPVSFQPSADGVARAGLTLEFNSGRVPVSQTVELVGTGRTLSPCQYKLESATVDFGRVPVGSEVSLGVGVRNIGSTACYLAGMQVAEGSDAAFTAETKGNTVLRPGERALLRVRFKPGAEGEFTGMAEGWVNHPTQGHVLVPMRGEGTQGCFSVQPTTLDFGLLRLTCGPKERELVVYNRCMGPVTVVGMNLEGDASDFKVAHPLFFPAVLPANSQTRMKVTYEPGSDGEDAAALRFDLGSGSPYTVGVVGRGGVKTEQMDQFIQQPQSQVDVLFVVDNSGSMMDEQQNLGANFNAFLSQALSAGVDYRIAVTTTGLEGSTGGWAMCPGGAEGGENGRFFPADGSSPRIITPTTPSAAAVFAHNTQVGVCHWNEQGLEAMYRALSEPLVSSLDDPLTPLALDGNAGFLREDARLSVVVVTDEEDFSPQPVAAYETFLRELKGGDASKVLFSAIVGPRDLGTCPRASSSGSRYIELAEKTGGVVESICTPDWAASLERLSERSFAPYRSFTLSERPLEPWGIVVRVDGVEVQAGWTYDPNSQSIRFEKGSEPASGASVSVTYRVDC
jgi:hypothetical protein